MNVSPAHGPDDCHGRRLQAAAAGLARLRSPAAEVNGQGGSWTCLRARAGARAGRRSGRGRSSGPPPAPGRAECRISIPVPVSRTVIILSSLSRREDNPAVVRPGSRSELGEKHAGGPGPTGRSRRGH